MRKTINQDQWQSKPERHGWGRDAAMACLIIVMFIIGAKLGDPCANMEDPPTQRQQMLCE